MYLFVFTFKQHVYKIKQEDKKMYHAYYVQNSILSALAQEKENMKQKEMQVKLQQMEIKLKELE